MVYLQIRTKLAAVLHSGLLRWNMQQGIIPIPKSKNPGHLAENIAVFDFAPEGENMAALGGMNQNRRTSHDPLTFDF